MSGSRAFMVSLVGATALVGACSSDTGILMGSGGMPSNAGKGAGGRAGGGAGAPNAGGGKIASAGGAATASMAGRAGATGGHAGSGVAAGASSAGTSSAGTSSASVGGLPASVAGSGGGSNNEGGGGGDIGDGGSSSAGESGGGSAEIPAGYVKAIMGVGYGGIRIVSRDGGNTWGDRVYASANGGDDDDLLRAVAYGKGRWIATGWKLMSSDDGLHWTDHGKLEDGIIDGNPIIEGLAYKDGYFYAAGDGGSGAHIYRSADGLAWSNFGTGGDTVKHTGLTIHAGVFVSYGDSETSYQSTDGKSWTDMGIANATYCEGAWRTLDDCQGAWWFDDGYYILPEWGGEIRRSTTGSSFKTVYTDDQQNTFYRARAVAEGYVAPE